MNEFRPPSSLVWALCLLVLTDGRCWAVAPPAVEGPAMPIPAFLKSGGLIAKERTGLLEAVAAPKGQDLQAGAFLSYVRTGFVVQAQRGLGGGNILGQLQEPLGGKISVFVQGHSFLKLGASDLSAAGIASSVVSLDTFPTPEKMWKYRATRSTELLDAVTVKEVILSNRADVMLEAFAFKEAPEPAGATPGLVRTASGYFVGYLRDRTLFGGNRLTWAEVTRTQQWKYRLARQKSVELRASTKLFELADLTKSRRGAALSDKPEDARITPLLYEPLLQGGLVAVAAEIDSPKDDGVERPAAPLVVPPIPNNNRVPKETVLQSISVRFAQWTQAATQLSIEYEQQERSVFRAGDSNHMEAGPWKREKLQKTVSLQNDPDGAVRFTDKRLIYEITKEGSSVKMNVYEVQNNPSK